jgi:hypothetical protein
MLAAQQGILTRYSIEMEMLPMFCLGMGLVILAFCWVLHAGNKKIVVLLMGGPLDKHNPSMIRCSYPNDWIGYGCNKLLDHPLDQCTGPVESILICMLYNSWDCLNDNLQDHCWCNHAMFDQCSPRHRQALSLANTESYGYTASDVQAWLGLGFRWPGFQNVKAEPKPSVTAGLSSARA